MVSECTSNKSHDKCDLSYAYNCDIKHISQCISYVHLYTLYARISYHILCSLPVGAISIPLPALEHNFSVVVFSYMMYGMPDFSNVNAATRPHGPAPAITTGRVMC